nr:hypothetical protein [Phytohabitans houttuyneae]
MKRLGQLPRLHGGDKVGRVPVQLPELLVRRFLALVPHLLNARIVPQPLVERGALLVGDVVLEEDRERGLQQGALGPGGDRHRGLVGRLGGRDVQGEGGGERGDHAGRTADREVTPPAAPATAGHGLPRQVTRRRQGLVTDRPLEEHFQALVHGSLLSSEWLPPL